MKIAHIGLDVTNIKVWASCFYHNPSGWCGHLNVCKTQLSLDRKCISVRVLGAFRFQRRCRKSKNVTGCKTLLWLHCSTTRKHYKSASHESHQRAHFNEVINTHWSLKMLAEFLFWSPMCKMYLYLLLHI